MNDHKMPLRLLLLFESIKFNNWPLTFRLWYTLVHWYCACMGVCAVCTVQHFNICMQTTKLMYTANCAREWMNECKLPQWKTLTVIIRWTIQCSLLMSIIIIILFFSANNRMELKLTAAHAKWEWCAMCIQRDVKQNYTKNKIRDEYI